MKIRADNDELLSLVSFFEWCRRQFLGFLFTGTSCHGNSIPPVTLLLVFHSINWIILILDYIWIIAFNQMKISPINIINGLIFLSIGFLCGLVFESMFHLSISNHDAKTTNRNHFEEEKSYVIENANINDNIKEVDLNKKMSFKMKMSEHKQE